MNDRVAVSFASYIAASRVLRRSGARLFRRFQEQLAVSILLATFGYLPARCQDARNSALRQVAEASVPSPVKNSCFLSCTELSSGQDSAGPHNTQVRSSDGTFKKTLRRFAKGQADIYSAPFHRSNLKWDALFLAGTGAMIATDSNASGALPGNSVNVSRNISNVGLYGTSAAAAALWLSGMATQNEHARETGALSAEAFANAVPFYVGVQLISGRQRPIEGNGNGLFWRNNALNSSFPSGHALFTWSMASVIAREYPRPWVKWLVYGTATAVSVTRFSGREHFPSDVVVGSVVGYLIGLHIFQVHCKTGLSASCHTRKTRAMDRP